MPSCIVLVHDDQAFTDAVATRLRQDGHEVLVIDDSEVKVPTPRPADVLELTVTQATGQHPGLRVRVTGIPAGEAYAGFLGQFLSEPVSVPILVDALRRFGV